MDLYRIYVISLMLLKGNSIDKKSSQHKSNSFAKHKKNNKFIEIQKNLHLLISWFERKQFPSIAKPQPCKALPQSQNMKITDAEIKFDIFVNWMCVAYVR